EKKLTLMEKIKHEFNHYKDGTKLLGLEMKISLKLLYKMFAGYELTRRESKQLERTMRDMLSLFPFAMFVIIPFAELLLPLALKLMPNLLPSTYESNLDKEKKIKLLRKTRLKVSENLRQIKKEIKLPPTFTKEDRQIFTNFYRKIQTNKKQDISREELVKVAKLLKDDLILDNLSRPELCAFARYINIKPYGTEQILRYRIRHKMLQIKHDDSVIQYEGIDSLTTQELQSACTSRGIKVQSVSPTELKEDLSNWLEMRLVDKIPSTLLVLSTAYAYGSLPKTYKSQYDALLAVLLSLPTEVYHETELNVSEDKDITHKQRINVLKEQENLIESENKQE
ncbi:hypothetical protein PACTADRAFT_28376, partial [Pachysolen tannophilus NRRL Y-2460]